jgi:phospholipase/carboxylesterase
VPDVAGARAALTELLGWLDAAPDRLHTDPARTYVLGFSQGAMMSLGVLEAAPERVAGIVALSGRFSDQLFDRAAAPDAVARVPLLVAHGTLDPVLPIANGRQVRDTFAGRSHDFTYREFPVGHGIDEEELRLVAEWLSRRL